MENTVAELNDAQDERKRDNERAEDYKAKAEREITKLSKDIKELEVNRDALNSKLERANEGAGNKEELLNAEIASLRENVSIL